MPQKRPLYKYQHLNPIKLSFSFSMYACVSLTGKFIYHIHLFTMLHAIINIQILADYAVR